MHISTPDNSYWVIGEPSKRTLKALRYTTDTFTQLALLSIYLGGCALLFMILGDSTALVVATVIYTTAVFYVYMKTQSRLTTRKYLQDSIRYGEGIEGVFSQQSFAYQALDVDRMPEEIRSTNKNTIDEYFEFALSHRLNLRHGVEGLIAFRTKTDILRRASEIHQRLDTSSSWMDILRERTLVEFDESYSTLRNRIESDSALRKEYEEARIQT